MSGLFCYQSGTVFPKVELKVHRMKLIQLPQEDTLHFV
jgi:hypothetical protein